MMNIFYNGDSRLNIITKNLNIAATCLTAAMEVPIETFF